MKPISLALAGDVVATREQHDRMPQARVYAALRAADLAIGNFEMALTQPGIALEKTGVRSADPAIGPSLSILGFDVLSVANNHTVDYGWDGLCSTMTALRRSGCAIIGAGATLDEACAPHIHEAGGVKVGVLAFSCLTPIGASAGKAHPGIAVIGVESRYEINGLVQAEEPGDPSCVRIRTAAREGDVAHAVALVRGLKRRCDHVVVSLHWGFGSSGELAEYQTPLAHALIDAGASVIHGHHPHAVQAIGFHHGCPIFYSHGTFMAEQFFLPATPVVLKMRAGMSRDGFIATIELTASAVGAIHVLPTVLDDGYQPRFAEAAELARIGVLLAQLSAPHGAHITAAGDGFAVSPATETEAT